MVFFLGVVFLMHYYLNWYVYLDLPKGVNSPSLRVQLEPLGRYWNFY